MNVNEHSLTEAQVFIHNALTHNFRSMDAVILGTAKSYSTEKEQLTIVTNDKAFKAAMGCVGYPCISLNI